jgi:DNA-binding winged helix-turn-helix (wHTH) protein
LSASLYNPRVSPGAIYTFGPFELDARLRRLRRNGEHVPLSERYVEVLLHLATHAGAVVPKDALVAAGWGDLAVTDNSIEQAISTLRRVLGPDAEDRPYIETVPRQGYRLATAVVRTVAAESHEAIEGLLAPHRAWIDGRAALETLERGQILRARGVFSQVVTATPDLPPAHVGLATAAVLQFEMTRTDELPDLDALRLATEHAYEACRLDPRSGEAWATLGFVLERAGRHTDALAASRKAIMLEPDNWRHHFRLSSIAWGEERLRAARRTLALLPGFSLAHWLAATVLVARQTLDDATRDLVAGIAGDSGQVDEPRFSGVALHWLLGLIHLARGNESLAVQEFELELSNEGDGHLYARECCANTWYAIGAMHLRRGRRKDAASAFDRAVQRVARHPMARVGLALSAAPTAPVPPEPQAVARTDSIEAVLSIAAIHAFHGSHADAAQLVGKTLSAAPPGNAAWLLPVEPLLNVPAAPDEWASALSCLRTRAA